MTKVILERPDPQKIHFQVRVEHTGLDGVMFKLARILPPFQRSCDHFYTRTFPENQKPATHFLIYSSSDYWMDNPPFSTRENLLGIVPIEAGNVQQARAEAIRETYKLAKALADGKSKAIGCQTSDLTQRLVYA